MNKTKISDSLRTRINHSSKGMCEYIDKDGRCRKTTGLSIHHKNPRSNNGENSMKNLIRVCNFHRKLEHGMVKLDEDGIKIKQQKAKCQRLKNIVSEFTRGLLDGKPSEKMCLVVCMPLAGFLKIYGYRCVVTEGTVNELEHFWITLPENIIIDPTANQFSRPDGNPMPKIYVGLKPEWYKNA